MRIITTLGLLMAMATSVFAEDMIWSKKMFGKSRCCSRSKHFKTMRPTGHQAFDAY